MIFLSGHQEPEAKQKPPDHQVGGLPLSGGDSYSASFLAAHRGELSFPLKGTSVTAEISPHFQPEKWNTAKLKSASKHPLRLQGQLMYDASHRPCPRPPHSRDPARVSSWEIHPVYAIDVCTKKSLSNCKADNNDSSVWVPLDQWHRDE